MRLDDIDLRSFIYYLKSACKLKMSLQLFFFTLLCIIIIIIIANILKTQHFNLKFTFSKSLYT